MVSGQPVVAKKKIFFFGKSFLYIKRNFLSHRASLYLAPKVRMRRASVLGQGKGSGSWVKKRLMGILVVTGYGSLEAFNESIVLATCQNNFSE